MLTERTSQIKCIGEIGIYISYTFAFVANNNTAPYMYKNS